MRTWVAPFILAMALAGCQGDSTGSATVSKPGLPEYGGGGKLDPDLPLNKIQGQLVDPYVADALVCLDESDNGICDTGELTTRSDANGVFTFELGSALSSAAQLLVINEGTLQHPHYGRHVGNDFQIALNAKLAAGKNSIIITPAVAAKSVMGTSTAELAAVLNDNFGQYLSVQLTAEDLEVDPFAEMILTDHARFVEVQKAQQTIAGLLFIFQHINSWDGYYDFVANFADNAATPKTTTNTAPDGTVTSTTEEKPLFTLIEVMLQQANAVSLNVLPTSNGDSLMSLANAYVDDLRGAFDDVMPSGVTYVPLPAIDASIQANINAMFFENYFENIRNKLIASFVSNEFSEFQFWYRLKKLNDVLISATALQKYNDIKIQEEVFSKIYLSANSVMTVIDDYSEGMLADLKRINQYASDVLNCGASKRFYLGVQAEAGTFNAVANLSPALVCADETFGVDDATAALNSFGLDVGVELQEWANLPYGSVRVGVSGCNIEGNITGKAYGDSNTSNYVNLTSAPRYLPVYVRNAKTGTTYSAITDISGRYAFYGLPVPDVAAGAAGYYFGSYSGSRGGIMAGAQYQSFKEVPVVCESGVSEVINVDLQPVLAGTVLKGTLDASLLGDGVSLKLEQRNIFTGSNTLSDNGVDAVWTGETIELDESGKHPYMSFDANTGEYMITHLTAGEYFRFRIAVGLQPGRPAYEVVMEDFFPVREEKVNIVNLSVNDSNKTVSFTWSVE